MTPPPDCRPGADDGSATCQPLGLLGALMRAGARPLTAFEQRAGWARLHESLLGRAASEWSSAEPASEPSPAPVRQVWPRRRVRRGVPLISSATVIAVAAVVGITTLSLGWAAGRAFISGKPRSPSAARIPASTDLAQLRGGTVLGGESAPARLVFSDGSQLTLPARARARVDALGSQGARIAILDGAVEASLAGPPSDDWQFSAGPFSIVVKGTSFMIDWSPSREHLVVRTHSGALQVAGPLVPEPTLISSGQTMTVALRDRRVIIDRGKAEGSDRGQL